MSIPAVLSLAPAPLFPRLSTGEISDGWQRVNNSSAPPSHAPTPPLLAPPSHAPTPHPLAPAPTLVARASAPIAPAPASLSVAPTPLVAATALVFAFAWTTLALALATGY